MISRQEKIRNLVRGEGAKIPKEYKWELEVRGVWAEAARRHLKAG